MTTTVLASVVLDPEVPEYEPPTGNRSEGSYSKRRIKGKFFRVFPRNGREWRALLYLEQNQERYAFAADNGDGVCLTERGFAKWVDMINRRAAR
jgi:hypothetical protein